MKIEVNVRGTQPTWTPNDRRIATESLCGTLRLTGERGREVTLCDVDLGAFADAIRKHPAVRDALVDALMDEARG